jgi:hypothetical protein
VARTNRPPTAWISFSESSVAQDGIDNKERTAAQPGDTKATSTREALVIVGNEKHQSLSKMQAKNPATS